MNVIERAWQSDAVRLAAVIGFWIVFGLAMFLGWGDDRECIDERERVRGGFPGATETVCFRYADEP